MINYHACHECNIPIRLERKCGGCKYVFCSNKCADKHQARMLKKAIKPFTRR